MASLEAESEAMLCCIDLAYILIEIFDKLNFIVIANKIFFSYRRLG